MKKKFNFKLLLVCVLVLLMVVALVACNTGKQNDKKPGKNPDDNNNDNPTAAFSSADYFDTMWACSTGIGEEVIGEDDDLGVNAQLELEIGTKNVSGKNANMKHDSINIGIDISLVLDRTAADNYAHTAAKLRLYSGAVEIATLYYFVSDPSKLYIDFDGKHIAMGVNLGGELDDNKVTGALNGEIGKYLAKLIGIGEEDGFNSSIIKLTKDMGKDWNLNKLVGVVLDLIPDFDLREMLEQALADEKNGELINSILGIFNITVDDLFDEDGNVNLYNILTIEALGDMLDCKKVGNMYSCNLTTALNTVGMFVSQLSNVEASISFEVQNERFKDGVTIAADLKNNMFRATAQDGSSVYPYVVLGVKHLNFRNATDKQIVSTAVDKAQYGSNLALDLSGRFVLNGLNIDTTPFTMQTDDSDPIVGKQIELLGEIALDLVGNLDLSGETDSPITAKLVMTYRTPNDMERDREAKNFIEATLIGDELAIKFTDPAIRYTQGREGGYIHPLHDIINSLGGTINSILGLVGSDSPAMEALNDFLAVLLTEDATMSDDFKGVVIKGIDVNTPWLEFGNGLKEQAEKWFNSAKDADGSAEEEAAKSGVSFDTILSVIKAALNILTFEDGKISVDGSNLVQRVSQFAQIFGVEGAASWSEQSIIDGIVDPLSFLVDDGMEFFKNCYHGLQRLLHLEDLADEGITLPTPHLAKRTGEGDDKYTVEEVAAIMFEVTYGHVYNEETCVDTDSNHAHANCEHLYGVATTAANYILNNDNADRAKAFDMLVYDGFFGQMAKDLTEVEELKKYNGGLDSIMLMVSEGPTAYADWYFVNRLDHAYDAEKCVGEDHEECAQLYKALKNDFLVCNIMMLGTAIAPSFDGINELIEGLKTQIAEGGMGGAMALVSSIINYVFDMPQLFKDLSSAISVDGVDPYDPEEGNYVAYLFETFINGLEASLTLDFTDGIDLELAFGAGGDFVIELDLGLDVVQLPTIESLYDEEETGWFVYTIGA